MFSKIKIEQEERKKEQKEEEAANAMHNGPAVNQKLLKIEQAQTNLKWSILSCDFQKYWS